MPHSGVTADDVGLQLHCRTVIAFCIRASSAASREIFALGRSARQGRRHRACAPAVRAARPGCHSLFELRQAGVAQRDAHDGGDERRPKARAHPFSVVVAPGERDVAVPLQHVDDEIDARPTIAEIARDHESEHANARTTRAASRKSSSPIVSQERRQQPVEVAAPSRAQAALMMSSRNSAPCSGSRAQDGAASIRARAHGSARASAQSACGRGRHPGLGRQLASGVPEAHGVVDQLEEGKLVGLIEAVTERLGEERTDGARRVAEDVPRFFVLAVDIAHHVNGSHRQRQHRLQVGLLRQCRLGRRGSDELRARKSTIPRLGHRSSVHESSGGRSRPSRRPSAQRETRWPHCSGNLAEATGRRELRFQPADQGTATGGGIPSADASSKVQAGRRSGPGTASRSSMPAAR